MATLICKITGKDYIDCDCALCVAMKKSLEVKQSPENTEVSPSDLSALLVASLGRIADGLKTHSANMKGGDGFSVTTRVALNYVEIAIREEKERLQGN